MSPWQHQNKPTSGCEADDHRFYIDLSITASICIILKSTGQYWMVCVCVPGNMACVRHVM